MCGFVAPLKDKVKNVLIYERLMKDDDVDTVTSALLQQIFEAWLTLLFNAAGDYLPGKRFAEADTSMSEQTRSVPRHKKFPELVLSLLDKLTMFRPLASTLCNESNMMSILTEPVTG